MGRKFIYIALFLVAGCGEETPRQQEVAPWTKDQSVKLGEELAKEEDLSIRLYVEGNPEEKYDKTGTGLYYWVYDSVPNSSVFPEEGDKVCVDLEITQLDKTPCYKTEEDECLEIIIDKSEAESGLQEGLKLMKQGESARLIIPSHLAHGLIGDQDKIPPLTTLMINVKIVELYR